MSGFAIGTPLLLKASYVLLGVHAGSCFSIHLSGIVKGFTQSMALPGAASAVAVAPIVADVMPKYAAISVDTGFPRSALRQTVTFTRLCSPVVGLWRNSTSGAVTETLAPIT